MRDNKMDHRLTAPQKRMILESETILNENILGAAAGMIAGILQGTGAVAQGVGAVGQGAGQVAQGIGGVAQGAGAAAQGAGEAIQGVAHGGGGVGIGKALHGAGESIYDILTSIGKRFGVIFYDQDVEKIKRSAKMERVRTKAEFAQAKEKIARDLQLAIQKKKADKKYEKKYGK